MPVLFIPHHENIKTWHGWFGYTQVILMLFVDSAISERKKPSRIDQQLYVESKWNAGSVPEHKGAIITNSSQTVYDFAVAF